MEVEEEQEVGEEEEEEEEEVENERGKCWIGCLTARSISAPAP